MDLRDKLIALRKESGLKRKEFAQKFDIPYRTLQDWELGNRKMPEYLLRLMAYRVRTEELVKANKMDPDQVCMIGEDGDDNEEEV